MNLSNWVKNRRTDHRNRASVEHLHSFKSNHTNNPSEQRSIRKRQSTCRSNANLSDVRQKNINSQNKKSLPRKIETDSRNIFKRDLNINPKFKKFIESKLQKGIKLHSEFLEKGNIVSTTKSKDTKLNMSFISSVRPQLKNSKMSKPSQNPSKIYIKDDQNPIPLVISSISNLASPTRPAQASRNEGRKSLV